MALGRIAKDNAVETKSATVTTTAVSDLDDFSFTTTPGNRAKRAIISCVTNNVMVTWSGTDPTSTLGHPIVAAVDTFVIEGSPNVANLRLLALSGSATVTITIER